jgi:hypothetical protein
MTCVLHRNLSTSKHGNVLICCSNTASSHAVFHLDCDVTYNRRNVFFCTCFWHLIRYSTALDVTFQFVFDLWPLGLSI